jgi:hypothetical protein
VNDEANATDLVEEWIASLPVSLWGRAFATDNTGARNAAEWFVRQVALFATWKNEADQ